DPVSGWSRCWQLPAPTEAVSCPHRAHPGPEIVAAWVSAPCNETHSLQEAYPAVFQPRHEKGNGAHDSATFPEVPPPAWIDHHRQASAQLRPAASKNTARPGMIGVDTNSAHGL